MSPKSYTLAQARDAYFRANGFGADGGYNAAWVDFKLGPIPMPFPNTHARSRTVRYHDLHHIVTGYRTNALGEFEISAWELGSGCADHAVAWHLNLSGLVAGALFIPRRTWLAFVRGRHSLNFYRVAYDEALLSRLVDDARRDLQLDQEALAATVADVVAFATCLVVGSIVGAITVVIGIPLVIAGNVVAVAAPGHDSSDTKVSSETSPR